MSNLYFWIIGIIITIIIIGIQYILTSLENKYLGGILPLLYLCFMVLDYYRQPDSIFRSVMATLAGLYVLLDIWKSGRSAIKNKKELEI